MEAMEGMASQSAHGTERASCASGPKRSVELPLQAAVIWRPHQ